MSEANRQDCPYCLHTPCKCSEKEIEEIERGLREDCEHESWLQSVEYFELTHGI